MKVPKVAKTAQDCRLKGLNYAVKHSKGYTNRLMQNSSYNTVQEFASVGFINTGTTAQGHETYKTTSLGKRYYKDTFGVIDYYKARLSGFIERMMEKN